MDNLQIKTMTSAMGSLVIIVFIIETGCIHDNLPCCDVMDIFMVECIVITPVHLCTGEQ